MDVDYRRLFEAFPGLTIALRPDGDDFEFLIASDDYLNGAGYTRQQLVGKKYFQVFAPASGSSNSESFDRLRASLLNVARTGKPGHVSVMKYMMPKPGGSGELQPRYWVSRHNPVLDKNGKVELILHRAEEVTDFVDLADKGEKEVQERFFQVSLDMLCISSYDGYFKKVNPAFQDVLGYSPEEFCSQPYLSYIHPDDIEKTKAEIEKQLLLKQKVLNFENRYRAKDGTYKLLSWKSAPVGDLMYAAARDITSVRAAEVELRQTRDKLQVANRELESFSYSAAHDLRAPLRSMSGFVNIVLEDKESKLSEDALHCMRRVSTAAVKMGRLIDGLLNLSQVARREVNPVQVNLTEKVRDVFQELMRSYPGREAKLDVAEGLTAMADPQLLRAALSNLLGNALKYTAKLQVPAEIKFGYDIIDGRRTYYVRDNGAGFDMKYSNKLFGVFQRLHSPNEFDGIGVGLATTLRIINAHGGKIWAEGTPGKGATFYFTL